MDYEMKDKFYTKIGAYYANQPAKKPFTRELMTEIVNEIYQAKNKSNKKTRREYHLLSTYDVLSVGEEKFLIKKRGKNDESEIKYLVAYEDLYDRCHEIHISTGHGGNVKMRNAVKIKYVIPRPCIEAYLSVCQSCNEKKAISRKLVVKPITSKDFNERGQIDLIDFQSLPDGKYKWILNYQDHCTKFVSLRPLQTKRAAEVAHHLLQIFLTFGAPRILQSDNGREFVNNVIIEMKTLWPECVIVHGRPRHPQSQGSIERSNQDIENMIRVWIADNNCTNWANGLSFVQWQKNTSYHRIIGRSPYKALFGHDPRVGFTSSNVPKEILCRLVTEEDAELLLRESHQNQTNEPESDCDETLEKSTGLTDESESVSTSDKHVQEFLVQNESAEMGDSQVSTEPELLVSTEVEVEIGNTECQAEMNIKEKIIQNERVATYRGQKRAAEKMLSECKRKNAAFTVNDCVLVAVPKVDRGPSDPQNIIGVIVDCKNGVYQIGLKCGVLKGWYGHDALQPATSDFLTKANVDFSKQLSLREAVAQSSGGQGVAKCTCKPSKQQCKNKRCLCFKSKKLCTSRCHNSLSCANK